MKDVGGSILPRFPRGWIWPLAMVVVALGFWVVFLGQAEEAVFGRVPILDEVYYLDQAAAWSEGSFPPDDAFFVSPLYPLLIALAGSGDAVGDTRVIPPAHLRGIRLLQIVCWLGTLGFLRLTAGRVLGKMTGAGWRRDLAVWLPAILFALYRPAAVYSVSILLEMPLTLLVSAAIYLGTRMVEPSDLGPVSGKRWAWLLALGVVIGLAGLLRGTAFLLMAPAVILVAANAAPGQNRFGRVLLVVVAGVAVLAPAVYHNSRLAGRLTGPTLNAGVNLFIGNGPEAEGFYVAVVPGDWRYDPAGRKYIGERWGIPTPTLAETDRIWRREAWLAMQADIPRIGGLWLKKVWLHLQGWEIDQLIPLEGWRRSSPVLAWLPVPYALLVALGLGGIAGRWSDAGVRWWAAALAVMIAGQSLFFVVSRYRLALAPVFCLLAVVGLREIWRKNRRAMVVTGLAVLLTIPWGLDATREVWRAQALANEAHRWAEIGAEEGSSAARDTAESLFREALAGQAAGPAPWLGLAALLVERDEPGEAEEILTQGARANPGNLDILRALLARQLEAGRRQEALELTAKILADHPRDADTLHNRAVLLAEVNRPAEALITARELVACHPADPRGYIDQGVILARSGRRDEARAVFQRGLQVLPGHPLLQKNLELLGR